MLAFSCFVVIIIVHVVFTICTWNINTKWHVVHTHTGKLDVSNKLNYTSCLIITFSFLRCSVEKVFRCSSVILSVGPASASWPDQCKIHLRGLVRICRRNSRMAEQTLTCGHLAASVFLALLTHWIHLQYTHTINNIWCLITTVVTVISSITTTHNNRSVQACYNVTVTWNGYIFFSPLLGWRDSLVVSVLDHQPRGRGFEPSAGHRQSHSNRGPVALCTLGLGLLNPPSSRGW